MWSVSASPEAFTEAIAWFRGKVAIPEPEFRLLSERATQWAFFVSGVASLDVLADVWESIMAALEQGLPYADWAKQATPVLRSAWGSSRPWHVETIFRTNVQHAYSAGRWKQLKDDSVRKARPYWMYDSVLDVRTTEICRERDGVVRPNSDPWWATNWPPLHYNCRSGVRALTPEEASTRGISQDLPTVEPLAGFGASPDATDWIDSYSQRERQEITNSWESAFIGEAPTWKKYGLPERLPAHDAPAPTLPTADEAGRAAFLEALRGAIGGLPEYVADPTNLWVVLDSNLLAALPMDGRERYLSWLPDLVRNPAEIWLMPVRKPDGKAVVFRVLYTKKYTLKNQQITVVAEFHRGVLADFVAYTSDVSLNSVRRGILRYPRKEKQ